MWPTYEVLSIGEAATVDLALAEARQMGMEIARVHVSWADLEPRNGEFAIDELTERLDAATSNGARAHVLIETIDSEGFVIPADLMGSGDDPYALAEGMTFDDPTIVARFDALLDRVVPTFRDRVFAISVGNEPDNRFDDIAITSAEGEAWASAIVGFTQSARTKIHGLVPQLPVAMTVTQRGLELNRDLSPIASAGDVLIINYYCQDPDFLVQAPAVVAGELDQIVQLAAGRQVIIQELGCPAGRASSVIGASEAGQAEFFGEVTRQIELRPDIRAAFVFQAVDWSPDLVRDIEQELRAEGLPELAEMYSETLSTIGLLELPGARPRAAWNEVLAAIARTERAR